MYLLKYFKELTVNPKNAYVLKGLILQLAIQGKLTTNWRKENSDIEPASELLDRIKKEKEKLVKEKKIRKEKVLPKIAKEETSYEIPKSWVWCRMGDLFSMSTGKGYKKSEYSLSGIKLFQIANVSFGQTSWDTTIYLPDNYASKYPEEVINEGDLVMALNRPLLKNKLKVAVLDVNDGPSIIYQRVGKFNFHLNNMSNWMLNYLQSPFFIDWLSEQVRGINIPFVNQTKLYQHITVLPPLEEQKEIVNVVETLFKEVEQLEQLTVQRIGLKEDFVTSALQQLTTNNVNQEWRFLQDHFKPFFNETSNIKKLRETVLQLAVQGKLTRSWRESHPELVSGSHHANELLKRIQKEKAQLIKDHKIKKEKPLPPITQEEIPYELPEGWVWCRLGIVTDIIAGASFKSGDFNETGGVKCIKITNAGVRNFVETDDFLPKGFNDLYPNYLIKEGDLILALTRPYIKDGLKISICPPTYNNSLLNQRVASIRSMTNNIYHPYIFTFIQSPKVLNYYKSKFDGKSQQPNMKMGDITDLLISIPPKEEQKVIVQKVNALTALCDILERELQQSQEHSEKLMHSCLREVFEGKREVCV
ncbi:restriction endonuclease subunit S [Arenibacter algicola]|uniref:restriction endonuclease subunit S n=1 Tax=Arenibacter algicola TaxID=616991 RepID=UPI0004DF6F68|nr:restriction endonuclease subunit S [Arenibacter algicola]